MYIVITLRCKRGNQPPPTTTVIDKQQTKEPSTLYKGGLGGWILVKLYSGQTS